MLDSDWLKEKFKNELINRSKIKHPDHKTIVLNTWHMIHLSRESSVGGSINAFID
jgi:hypothetical protein